MTENDYLYAGEQRDPATGLTYLRARYLDTAAGRFISADPFEGMVERPMSLHRYLYASASPVNRIDPGGLFDFSLLGTTIATGITAFNLGFLAGTAASAVIKVNRGFDFIRVGRATKDVAYELIAANMEGGIETYIYGEFISKRGGKEIGDAGDIVSEMIMDGIKTAFTSSLKALGTILTPVTEVGFERVQYAIDVTTYLIEVDTFLIDPDSDTSVSLTRKAIDLVVKAAEGL